MEGALGWSTYNDCYCHARALLARQGARTRVDVNQFGHRTGEHERVIRESTKVVFIIKSSMVMATRKQTFHHSRETPEKLLDRQLRVQSPLQNSWCMRLPPQSRKRSQKGSSWRIWYRRRWDFNGMSSQCSALFVEHGQNFPPSRNQLWVRRGELGRILPFDSTQ